MENLPENSKIKVETNHSGSTVIEIPHRENLVEKFIRIGGGLIFIIYPAIVLKSFFLREKSNFNGSLSDKIITYTLFAVVIVLMLMLARRHLRKSIPETLSLSESVVILDSGIEPIRLKLVGRITDLFDKRVIVNISQSDLKSLRLIKTGDFCRLVLDKNFEQIDLALDATESDKEWLYRYFRDFYNLKDKVQPSLKEKIF